MKALLASIVIGMAVATGALAQGPSDQAPLAQDMIHEVMGHVSQSNAPRTTLPAGVNPQVGQVLPQSVEINRFPSSHRAREHAFVRVGDTVLLVDPSTRRVMHVLR